ncbi:hypothetical protein Tco_1509242 [Tanacetum coccineum]
MMTLNFADTHYMVKTINGEVQLQALVDGKKVIVTEASVRSDLQLDDEEGTKCLPNATIFEELTRMGAKTTAWNEFCSTMASVVICLATNQKFNFSKYIFKSMVKNSDNEGKFLMYPRFVQIFLDKQVDGMESHKRIYIAPSHTKKIFTIMRRSGKDFSGRVTPLFLIMVVQYQAEMGEDEVVNKEMDDSLERATTTATGLDAEQDRGCQKHRDTIAKTRSENVSKLSNDPLLARESKDCLSSGDYKFETESQEVREERRVKNSQAQKIIQVPDSKKDDVVSATEETVSAATITNVELTLAQTLAELKSAKSIAAASTRSRAKGIVISIQKMFDKAFKRVNTFVDMDTELVEGNEVRAEGSETRAEGSSKRAGDELEQENAKKQKMNDEQEIAELQILIEIVSDEEGIAIDAIPLATKPPSISKRYLTFLNMLKDFDREDLETLWKLMKDKHGSTRPEEGYKRVLWGDLKTMYEPNIEDEILKMQQMYRLKLLLPVEVKTAKLMLLVYKLLLLVFRVNAANTKLQLLKD